MACQRATRLARNTIAQKAVSAFLLRYGLVLVIGWIGAMKFAAFEAEVVQPLVASGSLLSWMYRFLSV
jgi:reactive chlorine resistance protein C